MAFTGIILRRGSKASLIQNPPRQGEIVFATDTYELGMLLRNDTIHWHQFDIFNQVLKDKLDTIEESANNYILPVASSTLGGIKNGADISIDGDGYVTINELSNILQTLAEKQDILVSRETIKTINDQPILGSGNIEIVQEETPTYMSFIDGELIYRNELDELSTINLNSNFVTSLNGQVGDVTIDIGELIPDVTNNAGKILGNDGVDTIWVTPDTDKYFIDAVQTTKTIMSVQNQQHFIAEYNPSNVDVYLNGILLVNGTDYIATDGHVIILTAPISAGNTVQVHTIDISGFEKVYTKTDVDTIVSGLEAELNDVRTMANNEITKNFILAHDKQPIDSFPLSEIRSAEYLVTCSSRSGYKTSKFIVLHDNINSYIDIYSNIGSDLGLFEVGIDGSTFNVTFNPYFDDIEVKYIRTNIINNSQFDVVIPEDLMNGNSVIDLMNDNEIIDLDDETISGDLLLENGTIDLLNGSTTVDLQQ